MATRTVRLDKESERVLEEVRTATGLPIPEALKLGLLSLLDHVRSKPAHAPHDIYSKLELGPGGYSVASSTDIRAGVRKALGKKLGR